MAFWDADMTTRMGADSAAANGGLACFIYAGFNVLGAFLASAVYDISTPEGMAAVGASAFTVALAVIAGFRMRAGKGAFLGIGVASIMAFSTLVNLAAGQIGFGIIITVVFFVVLVQGIRGALALRKGNFDDDDYAVFD